MDTANLLVTHGAGHGRITLNRPERRNALSLALLEELDDALETLGDDPAVRTIIIEGAGPVFSAGHDLGEMIDRDAVFYDQLFTTCTDVMERVQRVTKPVIAKVHGMATAAGCQLVAACDLAVVSQESRFATPGVSIGLFCSTPMVPVSRAIGRKRALQMLFTGDPIDAVTACDWGLVNRVVHLSDLEQETVALADRIATFSSQIIAVGKRAFYQQIDERQSDAYEIAGPIMSSNALHPDAQEGMRAFLDKRQPRWQDR